MHLRISSILLLLAFAISVVGQDASGQKVTSAFAILMTSIESKTATIGQELSLRTVSDVSVKGQVVIPKGSIILAHVSDVQSKSKDQAQTALAIIIEKARKTDGVEIPLEAIIAAIAAPKDNSLTSDPAYGMLHSNEPRMTGAGAGNASRTGDLTASSKAGATSAVATADLKGPMEGGFLLDENSSGAIGYEGLALSWGLAAPPPFTIFVSKNKSIKLSAGTQILLRMAPPRLPQ